MATEFKNEHEPSVTTLVSGIISDAQLLITQQFELLKHEIREDFRKTKDASLICAAAAGLSIIAAILLAFMLAHLLSWAWPELPLWGSYGICGGVILALAVGLFFAGMAKFKSFNPLPDQSTKALKENVQWITNPK